MTYNKTEVTDPAKEKFSFLVSDYGFIMTVQEAKGTYLSQIYFRDSHLEIFIGIWGPGNEFWFTFKPLDSNESPSLELEDILNGITNDSTYFDEHIRKKTDWPIFSHTFPEYFELCALELKTHGRKIFSGDLSQWIDMVKNLVSHRVERTLRWRQRTGSLELDEGDKKSLEPLVVYIKAIDPTFSVSELQFNILDKLTR